MVLTPTEILNWLWALGIRQPLQYILAAAVLTESGGNLLAVGDSGHSVGPYQMHDQGRGAGMQDHERQDFEIASRAMLPHFQKGVILGQQRGLSGEELAVVAYLEAERPYGYPNEHGSAANAYRTQYRRLQGVAMDPRRAQVLRVGEGWIPTPYRMVAGLPGAVKHEYADCSSFVVNTFREAGLPFGPGVRTAEQIRQVCLPIDESETLAGDLIFFTGTYQTPDPASHIGISYGKGSGQMLDCNSTQGVGKSRLSDYWQRTWLEVRRPPQLAQVVAGSEDLAALLQAEREWGTALLHEIGQWADTLEGSWWFNDQEAFDAVLATMREHAKVT
jgi:cell wall-associated NlpC family hydrolase